MKHNFLSFNSFFYNHPCYGTLPSRVLFFLPLLWRFNPAEPVVDKSVILWRIKMSRAFPRIIV